nr:hypothetical protein [Tanacetum cinerariifolium]
MPVSQVETLFITSGCWVVTGETTGIGTIGDDGETGKELNDHSGDNGVVESDEAVECDVVILVSDGSEALNSSPVRGEIGKGSGELGVWSDGDGDVLAASS